MIDMIIIGIVTGCLVHFINYCIGKPGSEKFSPYEIFSSYSVWLSIRRLKSVDLYKAYMQQYNESISRTEKKYEVLQVKNDFKKILYEAADPFFTWERAAGMCPVCFGFWISIISGLVFTKNIIFLLTIIVITHVTIRLLNKTI